jgi:hypothetical protein
MRTKVIAAVVAVLVVVAGLAGYLATSGATRSGTSSSSSAFTSQTFTSSRGTSSRTSAFTYQTVTSSTVYSTTVANNTTTVFSSVVTSTFNTTWVPGEPIPVAMVETADIPIGQGGPMAIDPGAGRIYVAEGSSLVVVDASSDSVVANITLPAQNENAVALDPGTHTLYVLVQGGVAVVNGSTDTVVRTIPVDFGYSSLAYDPSTHVLYGSPETVSPFGPQTGSLLGVDARTGSLVANISIGYWADQVQVDPTTNMVLAAGCDEVGLACNSTASVVNGASETLVRTLHLGSAYYETTAADPSTHTFYVSGERQLVAVSATTGVETFSADPQSCGAFSSMAVDTSSDQVLMVPQNANYLLVYDGTSGALVNMYTSQSALGPLAFDASNGQLYVATADGQLLALRLLTATGNVNATLLAPPQGYCLPV